jgi:formylmethanofuran dehydrogenase subunit C
MATITGTVRKNDLEGGFLELVTDEGDVYRLAGSVEASGRVKVTGKIEKGGFGIHMSGPSITVESVEPA